MKIIKIGLLFLFISILFLSCSNDDKSQPCMVTNVSMLVNGELQTFQALGRGIDLNADGSYTLQLKFYTSSNDPFREQSISLILPYKKTGTNVIDNFIYHQYIDGVSFDGDFLNGTFQSKVITNRKTCFYATFSGTINDGNQEVIITDGKVSYEYEIPFDN